MKTVFSPSVPSFVMTTGASAMTGKRQKPDIKNASILTMTVEIGKQVETVFGFLIHKLKDNYTAMAEGHIKYEIIDGDSLKEGVTIECKEKAANQTVHHLYKVEKIIENEHIYYASLPSKVFIHLPWKTVESSSNSYCFYDLEKLNETGTALTLTIAIRMA